MESNEIILNLNLDLETERKVWNDYISNGLIPITRKCPKCNKNISIKENNSILNPYLGHCYNSKCRKILYLKQDTLFDLFPKTPISI